LWFLILSTYRGHYMKRLLIISILLMATCLVHGQTIQEAGKLMYYEKYSSALGMLHEILRKDNRNGEAWYLLTRCYLHENKIKALEDTFRLIPNDIDNIAFIECAKGALNLKTGNKEKAGLLFKSALLNSREKDPQILSAVAYANLNADTGDIYYVIDLFNKAIRRNKSDASLYVGLGNAYSKLANGHEAYKAYNKALEADPGDAEALYRLGLLFVSQNNPEVYLKYFLQATGKDPDYGPAWYALYYYYYFRDSKKAIDYLQHYIACSDRNPENNYRMTDLLYLTQQYAAALKNAIGLLETEDLTKDNRLYKLVAYSYKELNDSVNALKYMRMYFDNASDSSLIPKDIETMGDLYSRFPEKSDSAAQYYVRAASIEKDYKRRIEYYKTIAGLYKKIRDYKDQAVWLGKYYKDDSAGTNTDLFNWGIAEYLAGEYKNADTVFSDYAKKYPDQTYGYYWAARSDAAIDTTMQNGMAIPDYKKVIDLSLKENPEQQNKKWLIEAYGYIAAYKANIQKDYGAATEYLERVIELDPGNQSAKNYIEILKKNNSHAVISKNK
jgi:tetratricopeptide (TPR) repeat protein